MKKCNKCGIDKPLDLFYKCPTMKDGYFNKCKECFAIEGKEKYSLKKQDTEWRESEKIRHREKYKRLAYKNKPHDLDKLLDAVNRCNQKYPEKYKARISSNHMKVPSGIEKHHWSYNENHYKDIIYLTKEQHVIAHRYLIYDQERLMFRTISGVLLDTKEAHENYIKNFYTY